MNRRRSFYIGLSLILLTLAVYWPAVRYDFLNFDDDLYVTEKPLVQRGLTAEGVLWAFTNFEASNWHPVTWLSHMLDCSLFRMFPGGHHLMNIALHALNAVLLFLLLLRMTGAAWRSALVAGLFAWHPLHVESVAWIAERKDVLSTLFLLLTVWAYVRYAENPGPLRYFWVVLCFALGLMSKAMLVTVPALLLLLDFWPLGRLRWRPAADAEPDSCWPARLTPGLRALIVEKLPLFAMAFGVGVITLLAQKQGGAIQSLDSVPLETRAATALTSYASYLAKTFWPVDLAIPYPLVKEVPAQAVLIAGIAMLIITLVALLGLRRAQYLPVGWCWYLVTLLPVIGLVQVGSQAMADRYTYVPLIGVFMMLVWGAAAWAARWQISAATVSTIAVAALLGCLVATRGQLFYWQNSVMLFENALRHTRNNLGAHNNLGVALSEQGRSAEAMTQFFEALRIKTNYVKAHYNLSLEYISQGQVTQAIDRLQETLWFNPLEPSVHNNLGVMLAKTERHDQAISHLVAAVKLQPDYFKAHQNLARMLAQQGRYADALRHYRVAADLNPASSENLAAYAHTLVTCPVPQLRDEPRGVALAQRACDLTGHSQPDYLDTLAIAYARAGRFQEAASTAQKALSLAKASGKATLAARIGEYLKSYEAGKVPDLSPETSGR